MDFFDRQEGARKKTRWLVVYFLAAVLGIITCIYLVLAGFLLRHKGPALANPSAWWDASLFLWVAGGTCVVVLAGSLFKFVTFDAAGPLSLSFFDRAVCGDSKICYLFE